MTPVTERAAAKAQSGSRASGPVLPPALVLGLAVLAMSWSGPLVRLGSAPPLAVAAWRLILSVALIAIVVALRPSAGRARLVRGDWILGGASGLFLAAHFWTWIESLALTSVASSVALVSTQPIFVAILSTVFLREPPGSWQWAGIALAVVGGVAIGWGDWLLGRATLEHGRAPLLGDLLAISGAVFAACYYTIGRGLRQRLDLWTYIGVVYGVAALCLSAAVAFHPTVELFGYPRADWMIFIALAAGPMMIGHTGVNYALRYIPAYVANLAVLGEPVGATIIAWLLPAIGEKPPLPTLAGGALILIGIALGSRGKVK